MGFFDDLGSLINDVTNIKDDLSQTVQDAVTNISEPVEQIKGVAEEAQTNIQDSVSSAKEKIDGLTNL